MTPTQYERLIANYHDTGWARTDPPQIDAYLILHRFGAAKATYSDELLSLAKDLSDRLMREPEITKHVERIVCLDSSFDGDGTLVADKRWLHER